MAKLSIIAREKLRSLMSSRRSARRDALREITKSIHTTYEERLEAQERLQKLPRKTSKSSVRRRCKHCGRPRGVYRKFELCRIHLREALMRGDIPGGRKASW